jgi:TatD DNase family protein
MDLYFVWEIPLRNPELSQIFESVPNDRFFLETDAIEENIDTVYTGS